MVKHTQLESLLVGMLVLLLTACSGGSGQVSSSIRVRLPEAPSGNNSASSGGVSAFAWDKACFIINVVADDLVPKGLPGSSTSATACEVRTGIMVGSEAPGGELSVDVPMGRSRRLEIFTYLRGSTSEKCPSSISTFGNLDRTKIARVGEVSSFDTLDSVVTLKVSVSPPAAGVSVLSQYAMPERCLAAQLPPTLDGVSGVTPGQERIVGSRYAVVGSVGINQPSAGRLRGSRYQIQLNQGVQ